MKYLYLSTVPDLFSTPISDLDSGLLFHVLLYFMFYFFMRSRWYRHATSIALHVLFPELRYLALNIPEPYLFGYSYPIAVLLLHFLLLPLFYAHTILH